MPITTDIFFSTNGFCYFSFSRKNVSDNQTRYYWDRLRGKGGLFDGVNYLPSVLQMPCSFCCRKKRNTKRVNETSWSVEMTQLAHRMWHSTKQSTLLVKHTITSKIWPIAAKVSVENVYAKLQWNSNTLWDAQHRVSKQANNEFSTN